jgi:hypothetical protein
MDDRSTASFPCPAVPVNLLRVLCVAASAPSLPKVREQVGLTEAPCLECARDVLHEMRKVQRDATEAVKLLNAFPAAKAAISQKCNEILQEQHAECVKYLQTHVKMNQLRISYGHPDFHKDRILFEVEQKRYGTEDSDEDVALMAKVCDVMFG